MKKILLILPLLCLLLYVPSNANAHVLLTDDENGVAAVFHADPDDDPIAGEATTLYFDIQNKNQQQRIPFTGYELVITDIDGSTDLVSTTATGNTVAAEYTFPGKSLYFLSLRSNAQYQEYGAINMEGSIRVSRGTGSSFQPKSYEWAVAILVGSSIAIILLLLTGFNNSKKIAKYGRL